MSEYQCNFCDKSFSKLANLNKHQTTAKYCLKFQQEKASEYAKLTCEHCGKLLSRADSLNRHYVVCLDYQIHLRTLVLENDIKNLKQRLAEKEQQLIDKEIRLKELTTTAINKPHMQFNITGAANKYPQNIQTPVEIDSRVEEMYELVHKLYSDLVGVIGNVKGPLLLEKQT